MFRSTQALVRPLAASLALLLSPLVQAQTDASSAVGAHAASAAAAAAAAASMPASATAPAAVMADSPAATATAAPSNAAAQGHATTHAADGAAPTVGVHVGKVSYYGSRFAGRKTASGELFDPSALTMAHRTLPFGTRVRVTNLHTGHSVVVRVNDHGPNHAGRIGDLSHAAAAQLRMLHSGVVRARLEVLGSAQAKTARKGTRQAR